MWARPSFLASSDRTAPARPRRSTSSPRCCDPRAGAPAPRRAPRCGSLAVRKSIGLVFQEPTLDRDLTVEENLRFAARLWDLPGRAARARIDELLRQFGLAERRDSPVRALSGGLRRAADIAPGRLPRPPGLFLDEPTAGLEPRARRELGQVLPGLPRAPGGAGGPA